jgi:hypothetical protein
MQRQTLDSPYAALIAEATGASESLLPILEHIMREEVFHSTLDWQSRAEFRTGARKAHRIFLADPEFHLLADAAWKASSQVFCLECALVDARRAEDQAEIARLESALAEARLMSNSLSTQLHDLPAAH